MGPTWVPFWSIVQAGHLQDKLNPVTGLSVSLPPVFRCTAVALQHCWVFKERQDEPSNFALNVGATFFTQQLWAMFKNIWLAYYNFRMTICEWDFVEKNKLEAYDEHKGCNYWHVACLHFNKVNILKK